jgi:diguanylate cyclase (GGDEF)-like protein
VAECIISLLEEGPLDPGGWRDTMDELGREWGPEAYSVLLFVLAHLEFSAPKAREHWDRVLAQWEQLNASVPDGVDLRVAVLHYFLRIQRKLKNPAIVELKILKKTQDSAIFDGLTRLHNFRYFQDRVHNEVKRVGRYGSSLSLLLVDADDFKRYNDTRGHLAGNVALRRLARVLARSVREVDVVARYGGEEFAILLPSTPKLAALQVAEKVRQAVEKAAIGREGNESALTVSLGVACAPADAGDAESLIDKADRALYLAKSLGKNRAQPFSDQRREFTRVDAALMGRFSALADHTHPLTTLNVSEGGILFLSRHPLPAGTMVQVQLGLPPAGQPIECGVRVIRVVEEPEGYEVAAHIIDMSRPHERRFHAFLAALRAPEVQLSPAAPRSA